MCVLSINPVSQPYFKDLLETMPVNINLQTPPLFLQNHPLKDLLKPLQIVNIK